MTTPIYLQPFRQLLTVRDMDALRATRGKAYGRNASIAAETSLKVLVYDSDSGFLTVNTTFLGFSGALWTGWPRTARSMLSRSQ